MIIGFTGRAGTGKTTLAELLKSHWGYERYSFAKPLKDIAEILGFPKDWIQNRKEEVYPPLGVSPREFLQKFGTEVIREELPKHFPNTPLSTDGLWVMLAKERLRQLPGRNVVIDDVRFEDEVTALYDMGRELQKNVLIVKLLRNAAVNPSSHSSESGILHPDIYFVNDGLPESILDLLEYVIETRF